MGASGELLRRIPQRRCEAAVFVQVQLLLQTRRLTMERLKRYSSAGAALVAVATLAIAIPALRAQPASPQQVVDSAYAKFKSLKEGKNADYIPALAKVDPNLFGIALVTTDGK